MFLGHGKDKRIVFIIAALIIIFGVFFRFWQLNTIPPGLYHDEAFNGVEAIEAGLNNNYPVYYPANNGRNGLFINIIAFFFKFFGADLFTLRSLSALVGSLALPGLYLLFRELKISKPGSILALFILATSFWHLIFSRIAYIGGTVPTLIIWSVYFFYKGINTRKLIYFIASGIIAGLGLHTYIAFRIAPLIYIIIGFSYIGFRKDLIKIYWSRFAAFVFFALFVSSPIIIYYIQNPGAFNQRASQISVFSHGWMIGVASIFKSFSYHIMGFVISGDPNQRHNYYTETIIPLIFSVFLFLGMILACYAVVVSIRKKQHQPYYHASVFALAVFWIMILPGIFSIAFIPKTLRIFGTLPAVIMLIILPFEFLINKCKLSKQRRIYNTVFYTFTIIVIVTGFSQLNLYFRTWAEDCHTATVFFRKSYDIGLLMNKLPLKENNFLLYYPIYDDIYHPSAPRLSQCQINSNIYKSGTTVKFASYEKYSEYKVLQFPDFNSSYCENAQIVLFPFSNTCPDGLQVACDDNNTPPEMIEKINKLCPGLKAEMIRPENSEFDFYVWK